MAATLATPDVADVAFIKEAGDGDLCGRERRAARGSKLCAGAHKTTVITVFMRYPLSALIPSKNPTAWARPAPDRYI